MPRLVRRLPPARGGRGLRAALSGARHAVGRVLQLLDADRDFRGPAQVHRHGPRRPARQGCGARGRRPGRGEHGDLLQRHDHPQQRRRRAHAACAPGLPCLRQVHARGVRAQPRGGGRVRQRHVRQGLVGGRPQHRRLREAARLPACGRRRGGGLRRRAGPCRRRERHRLQPRGGPGLYAAPGLLLRHAPLPPRA